MQITQAGKKPTCFSKLEKMGAFVPSPRPKPSEPTEQGVKQPPQGHLLDGRVRALSKRRKWRTGWGKAALEMFNSH